MNTMSIGVGRRRPRRRLGHGTVQHRREQALAQRWQRWFRRGGAVRYRASDAGGRLPVRHLGNAASTTSTLTDGRISTWLPGNLAASPGTPVGVQPERDVPQRRHGRHLPRRQFGDGCRRHRRHEGCGVRRLRPGWRHRHVRGRPGRVDAPAPEHHAPRVEPLARGTRYRHIVRSGRLRRDGRWSKDGDPPCNAPCRAALEPPAPRTSRSSTSALGSSTDTVKVSVRWPTGRTQTLDDVAVDQLITVEEPPA